METFPTVMFIPLRSASLCIFTIRIYGNCLVSTLWNSLNNRVYVGRLWWTNRLHHMLCHVFMRVCLLGGGCATGVRVWCQGAGAGDCRHCGDRPGRLEKQHRVQRRYAKLQGSGEATEQRCRWKWSWHTDSNVRKVAKSNAHTHFQVFIQPQTSVLSSGGLDRCLAEEYLSGK